ncbi:RidA family protein [Arthrobacter pigmenti]
MAVESLTTDRAAPPGGPYAHATTAGNLVFLAGATPNRPDGAPVRGDFAAQATAAFDNLRIIAEEAGSSLNQALRVGVYLRDMDNFPAMNEFFASYFSEDAPPVRTTVCVDLPGFDIEVDAILDKNA